MSSYRVNTAFQAFEREYKVGTVLTADDLSCWLPDEDRAVVIDGLVRQSKIEALGADDSAGKYPPTWGSAPEPEPPGTTEPAT